MCAVSDHAARQVQDAEEDAFEFLVACGDAAELLGFVEQSFDAVAGAVGVGVDLDRVGAVGPARDLGHDVAGQARPAEIVAVESLVADEFVDDGDAGEGISEERFELRGLVGLAGHDRDGDHAVLVRGGDHDLGAQAAPTAAQGLAAG